MTSNGWILTGILLVAAALRFGGLAASPPGPTPDEISNAVDARFLAEAGRDHHGRSRPLYLRGFGDYREATFVYLSLPLGSVLEPWLALRVAAASIGLATVAVAYFAARNMFGSAPAAWSALFVAVNPQHILWSRIGMEVVLVPFGASLAWLALTVVESSRRFGWLFLAFSLALTIYSGMMGKPAAAILALAFLTRWPEIRRSLRLRPVEAAVALSALAAASVPAVQNASSDAGRARFEQIRLHADSWPTFARRAAAQYATYWSPQYLVLPHAWGFEQIQAMPDLPTSGKLSVVEGFALAAGLFVLLGRRGVAYRRPLITFLLLAAVPAALTNTIAPSRLLFALPALAFVMGLGAERWTAAAGRRFGGGSLLVGCAIAAGVAAADLAWRAEEWLGEFFLCDQRRILEALMERPEPVRIVDAALPFVFEYAIYASGASAKDVLAERPSLPGLYLGRLDRGVLPPGAVVAARRDRTTPNGETVMEIGRYKIVKTQERAPP